MSKIIKDTSTYKEVDMMGGEPKYIYERNPDTGQVYRRQYGDYDTPREPIEWENTDVEKE